MKEKLINVPTYKIYLSLLPYELLKLSTLTADVIDIYDTYSFTICQLLQIINSFFSQNTPNTVSNRKFKIISWNTNNVADGNLDTISLGTTLDK